jgi:hypothetical protein
MTIVADVKRAEMTAREETSTVIEEAADVVVKVLLSGVDAGVGYALAAAAAAVVSMLIG